MSKPRGNPKWNTESRWHAYDNVPITPTEFEQLLRRLAITESEAAHSQKVREWVQRWHRTRFIPIAILEAFQINQDFME
jgi:hypothetical protein